MKTGSAWVVGRDVSKHPPLIDRHIDQHRARLQPRKHFARDQLGRARARDKHRADDRVGKGGLPFDFMSGREDRRDPPAEHFVDLAQTRQGTIQNDDLRPETGRHARRVKADDTAADHHDPRRRDAGHTAHQHARSAGSAPERKCGGLDRKPTGDLAHWSEQWQTGLAPIKWRVFLR